MFFAVFLDQYFYGLMVVAIIACVLSFPYKLDDLAYFEQGSVRDGVTTINFPLNHVRCRHSKICYLYAHLDLSCR